MARAGRAGGWGISTGGSGSAGRGRIWTRWWRAAATGLAAAGILCGSARTGEALAGPGAGPGPLAVTSGGHRSAIATYTLSVPTQELVDLLRGQLFIDSGRFYPCRTNPSCSAWGQDIALSAPSLSVEGARLVFSVHLVGTYSMSQFFAATIGGDLIVSGVPTARGTHVVLTQTNVSAGPASDMTFRTFLQAMHAQIESMIERSPGFDLAQYLSYSAADPDLPPPRLPNVRCVDPSQIQVQSVATVPASSAVSAVVSVGPPPPGKCGPRAGA